ncbi:MAG: hypothetical protein ACYCZY_00490 [Lacisediminihabitans sp.]
MTTEPTGFGGRSSHTDAPVWWAGTEPAGTESTTIELAGPEPMGTEPTPRKPTRRLGGIALALSAVFLVTEASAIVLAVAQSWGVATILAQLIIVLTAVSFIVGLIAVIMNRGRGLGMAAMLLSVVANPLVLVKLFALLGSS